MSRVERRRHGRRYGIVGRRRRVNSRAHLAILAHATTTTGPAVAAATSTRLRRGRRRRRRIRDLDDASIVAALESRRVGMKLLQMLEMLLGHLGRAATVLAHVQFGATLLVPKRQLDLMHLVQVRLETATLGELAIALLALEWSHARVGARVTFEIERVVEALVTERAQVAFDVAVVLHVTIHETLQLERLVANLTFVFILRIIDDLNG